MKRVFEIEYPDDSGPSWMNKDNLLLCLNVYCKGIEFNVEDVTDRYGTRQEPGTRYINADLSESPVSVGCKLEEL